jgi:hypothetical protein
MGVLIVALLLRFLLQVIMIEEVTVKQEPSMEDEPVTVLGNREDYLLKAEKKNQQFSPPLFCVDVKCEFQACICFHSAYIV